MEHLSEITLLGVIAVNIVSILFFCFIDAKTAQKSKKKNMIVGICLLTVILIFDVVCMASFIKYGVVENGAVFVLFVPLMGFFMYESVKELKETEG